MNSRMAAFSAGMTFSLLRTFVRVVETGNISAAARSLYIAQSAVSAQIGTLNRMAGTPLLERISGRWQTTAAGASFYRRANQMIALLEEAERDLADATGRATGHVTLASTRTITDELLADLIHAFSGAHPDIRVDVKAGNRAEAEHWLVEGEVDFGLVAMPLGVKGLEIHPFANDDLVAVIAQGHPLAGRTSLELADVEGIPFVSFERGSGVRALLEERLGERFSRLDIRMQLNSNDALLSCVELGIGFTFIPVRTARRWTRGSAVVALPVHGVDLRRELALAVRVDRARSQAATSFIAWLDETYRNAGVGACR
jgi:DNA-binding transcriptional LysR family regulator